MKTELLFRDDAYRRECDALLFAFRGDAVVLSATVFYARGGGQPGDSGVLILGDGARVEIADAVYDRSEGGDGGGFAHSEKPGRRGEVCVASDGAGAADSVSGRRHADFGAGAVRD